MSAAAANGKPARRPLQIVESRCKVCKSADRQHIDAMLLAGMPQVQVRNHWNAELGREAFTANNISSHARKHLHPVLEARARTQLVNRYSIDPSSGRTLELGSDYVASTIVRLGLHALESGALVPSPREALAAAQLLDQSDTAAKDATVAGLTREMKAFLKAVRTIVPQATYNEIYEEFQRLLG